MEADMAEYPRSARRALNVAWKGSTARLADGGLLGGTLDPSSQWQTGAATTALFSLVFLAEASKVWSGSMLDWNSAAVPSTGIVTVTTGILTLALAAMVASLGVGITFTLVSAFRPRAQRSRRDLVVPTTALLASATTLVIAVHIALRYVIARGGIEWTHPGTAIKQLAGAAFFVAQDFEYAVTSGHSYASVDWTFKALSPLALIVFGVAAMTIIRRTDFSPRMQHVGRVANLVVFALMLTFLVSFLVWDVSGGNAGRVFTQGASFPPLAFSVLAVLTAGCGSCLVHTRRRLL
jgi:hypothetical protein